MTIGRKDTILYLKFRIRCPPEKNPCYCQRIIIDLFEVLRCISNLSAIFRRHLIIIFSNIFFPLHFVKKAIKPCLQFC